MKTILITGANSGIGRALAILTAKHRHRLILLVRKESNIKPLIKDIEIETNKPNVEVCACDLSNNKEIDHFCNTIKESYSSIDILINNAGVYSETRIESVNHIELNLAVNVLAPFVLIQKLIPLLLKGNNPSVFNISSIGEKYGKLDFNDIQSKWNYSGNEAYNKSKLLQTMMTYKFAELYANSDITFNCIHPGATMTNLVSEKDIVKMPFLLRLVFNIVKRFRQSPVNSAKKIYEIINEVEKTRTTGNFFIGAKQVNSSKQSRDVGLINKTWNICLKLTEKESKKR